MRDEQIIALMTINRFNHFGINGIAIDNFVATTYFDKSFEIATDLFSRLLRGYLNDEEMNVKLITTATTSTTLMKVLFAALNITNDFSYTYMIQHGPTLLEASKFQHLPNSSSKLSGLLNTFKFNPSNPQLQLSQVQGPFKVKEVGGRWGSLPGFSLLEDGAEYFIGVFRADAGWGKEDIAREQSPVSDKSMTDCTEMY